MMEKCLYIEESEAFFNCMSETSRNYSQKFEDLKKTIVLLRRATIDEIFQK